MKQKRVLRILQVGMSPYYGGTEAFLMNQYRAIDRSKIQFDFLNVYNEKIACEDEIEELGGKIYHLDMARHHGLSMYHRNLDSFFVKNADEFDAVHCNFQSLVNIDILRYAKKYGIKVRIAHAHNSGYGVEPNIKQKLLIYINKIILQQYATHYFACSELAARWMFGVKATIVKNAINTKKFIFSSSMRDQVREQLKLGNCFTVIFVGRLDPQKNPIFTLEVFNELKKIHSNAKLLIVGDGILKQQIQEKIQQLKLNDDVHLLGNRTDVNNLLQAADVFLLPSRFEGLGIVLIEAQAAGLKTYTSANVVPKEVKITDLLEFISLDKSAKEWASLMGKSIDKRADKSECIIKAGYDNFANAKKLEKIYIDLVGKNL